MSLAFATTRGSRGKHSVNVCPYLNIFRAERGAEQ